MTFLLIKKTENLILRYPVYQETWLNNQEYSQKNTGSTTKPITNEYTYVIQSVIYKQNYNIYYY